MNYAFSKWQGAGNDFIIVKESRFPSAFYEPNTGEVQPEVIRQACDRHFGVGADGFMVLGAVGGAAERISMRFYNCDGYPASMCGNGARCAYAAAREWGLVEGEAVIETRAGEVHACGLPDGRVRIGLPDVPAAEPDAPTGGWILHTGVPHLVVEVDDIQRASLMDSAPTHRHRANAAGGGANVNYCQREGDSYRARTYERGVEAETLACGTGATAVALAMHLAHCATSPVGIRMPGGELEVDFSPLPEGKGWAKVYLTGPVALIAEGNIHAPAFFDS